MKLYRLSDGVVAEAQGRYVRIGLSLDDIFRSADPESAVANAVWAALQSVSG